MVRTGLLVAVLTLAAAASCKPSDSGSGKPRVAVSIFPIYDLTRRIAGDRFDVLLVLPPGKSEHGYDPTPKELARLEGAKLGIAVGHDMDGWVEKLMGDTKVFRVAEQVPTIPIDVEPIGEAEGERHEGHGGHDEHAKVGAPDPHVWLDPERMTGAVDEIAAQLGAIEPAAKDALAQNAAAVNDSLRKLDTAIAGRAKTWSKHTIVTFHGSMAYYARRYGLRIAAVVEPLAGKQPTPAYLRDVQGAIKRGRAAALFTEPQLDRAPGELIAKEAGIPLGELDPVGGVAGRDTYEALLLWNTDQLEKVLR
jgi:zinc transport system substrate-binding protein